MKKILVLSLLFMVLTSCNSLNQNKNTFYSFYISTNETTEWVLSLNIKYETINDSLKILSFDSNFTKEIVIPSKTKINGKTYYVKEIAQGAFKNNTLLEKITLPFIGGSKDNNQYLGYIFGADSYEENSKYIPESLKEVVILEGCTSIGESAFYECISLKSITIPNSVTSIEGSAFAWCTSLTSIIIPSSVTEIGYLTFDGCNSLTIYCEASSKPDGWDSQWNQYSNCKVVWGYKG